jgi:hypothetical protein
VTLIDDPLFYVLAVPVVLALGLSKGGFAGVGQAGTPLLALAMPPLEAAAIVLPISIVMDLTAMWVYRKDWNGRILALVMPGAIVGLIIATLVAAHISDAAVRVSIGVVTIAFVLFQWIGPKKIASETPHAGVPSGLFWGAVSGFTTTLCQAGGPPYMVYVLPQKLAKIVFVSTTAMYFGGLNILKVPSYLVLGQFSAKGLATTLTLLPLALLANQLGFWLVKRTPQEMFYKITQVLMLAISIELVRSGLTTMLYG